jgi:hypothetical protein
MLEKYFNHIVIMTDFDDKERHKTPVCRKCPGSCKGHNPGRDLGTAIASKVRRRISWASYGYKEVYPNGAKDCGDLTDDEIVQCIKNAASNFEYVGWQLY